VHLDATPLAPDEVVEVDVHRLRYRAGGREPAAADRN
jgi:hypothetical protein